MTASRSPAPGLFARFIAVLAGLLFAVTTPLVVVALVARALLFSPSFYKRALTSADVYHDLPAALAQQVASTARESQPESAAAPQGELGLSVILGALPPDFIETLIVRLIPQEWMQTQVEAVIDQVVAYLDHGQGVPELTISLKEIKANLNQGALESALREVMATLPPCTAEQLLTFGGDLLTGQTAMIPACRPPEALQEVAIASAKVTMEGMLGKMLPDQLSLMQPFGAGTPGGGALPFMQGLERGLSWLRLAKRVAEFSVALPLALLAIIALLTARTAGLALRWLGWPLLTAGLLSALAGLALYLGFGILAATVPMPPGAAGPGGLLGLVREVAQGMVLVVVLWIEASAGAMTLAGVVMTGVAGSLRRREGAAA